MKRDLIKIVIGVNLLQYSINLFLACLAYVEGGTAPLIEPGVTGELLFVDPLIQALVLTAIVVGFATTMFMVALAVKLHQHYGTFDVNEIRRLRG